MLPMWPNIRKRVIRNRSYRSFIIHILESNSLIIFRLFDFYSVCADVERTSKRLCQVAYREPWPGKKSAKLVIYLTQTSVRAGARTGRCTVQRTVRRCKCNCRTIRQTVSALINRCGQLESDFNVWVGNVWNLRLLSVSWEVRYGWPLAIMALFNSEWTGFIQTAWLDIGPCILMQLYRHDPQTCLSRA